MAKALSVIADEVVNKLKDSEVGFNQRMKQLEREEDKAIREAKERKKSTYRRWLQFNLEHTEKLIWLQRYHPIAACILSVIIDQMDDYNAIVCSNQVFMEILEIGRTKVSTSIRTLKENGFISVGKSGTTNVFYVNDSIYWKSYGNNKAYAKFAANVIISQSEQQKDAKREKDFKVKTIKYKEAIIEKKPVAAEAAPGDQELSGADTSQTERNDIV